MLYLATLTRTRAENQAAYRFEDYAEENGRIHVATSGAYFDTALSSWISLKGNYVHDAISGATPLGPPFIPGTNSVNNTVSIEDVRNAGFIEPSFKLSNHTVSPQVAYSRENDYESIGVSANDAIDFNDKNTTLTCGLSHSFDRILPHAGERRMMDGTNSVAITSPIRKDDTEVLLGLTQLLGPATTMTADLTLGYSDGFLNDPYKRVLFDDYGIYNPGPDPANPNYYTGVWPENRPDHKFRQVLLFSLNHNFEKLAGAIEATYRFYHDDFGTIANTASLQWNQKIGKHVIVSPLFRFYTQTAANFYATHFPGDPANPQTNLLPEHFSSDYRLSALNSFTYGLSVSARVQEHVSLDVSYQRYEMYGTDGVTGAAQYPKANVFAAGLTIWF